MYCESLFNTLCIEIKHKSYKWYKNCPLFSFTSSNSSQFYFYFAILIRPEAQGLSLWNGVWDFPFSILFRFIKVYIFVKQNPSTLWLWPHIVLFAKSSIFMLQREVLKLNDKSLGWGSSKTDLDTKLWERHFFLMVTFQ